MAVTAATTSTPKRSIPSRLALKAPLTAKANTPTKSIRWRYIRIKANSGRDGRLAESRRGALGTAVNASAFRNEVGACGDAYVIGRIRGHGYDVRQLTGSQDADAVLVV